jgi:hypothetical protein
VKLRQAAGSLNCWWTAPPVDAGTDDAEIARRRHRPFEFLADIAAARSHWRVLLSQNYIHRTLHLDRRASDLALVAGDDDLLLTPKQLAQWLGVSDQWVSIGRCRGYGPPFIKVAPLTVRYHRGSVRQWLNERSFVSTAGYVQTEATAE